MAQPQQQVHPGDFSEPSAWAWMADHERRARDEGFRNEIGHSETNDSCATPGLRHAF